MTRRATAAVIGLGPALVAMGQEPAAPPAERRPWALVGAVAQRVQSRAGREPWTPVASGAALHAGDGLRTLDRSSAEARFDAGGRVLLAESTVLAASSPRSAALEAGQIDVHLPADGAPLEIAAGGVGVSVRGEGMAAFVRVRAGGGTVRVMAFAGKVRVAPRTAAVVELEAGSGITIPSKGERPVERLLPSPVTSMPAPGAAPDHANPRLWWEELPGAAAYTVEVCRDEACADVADRAAAVAAAPWAPEGLPLGDLYWRVCAVAASGLDGLPSRPARFTIRSLWRKPHPRPKLS